MCLSGVELPGHADVGSAGVKLASPAVPDNLLTIASDLRAEHVKPNLRAIAPEVSENEFGVVVAPATEGDDVDVSPKKGKGKGKLSAGKQLSSANVQEVEAKAVVLEEEGSDMEGGEEEDKEDDPEVEVLETPKRKTSIKLKATNAPAVVKAKAKPKAKAHDKTADVSKKEKAKGGGKDGQTQPASGKKDAVKVKATSPGSVQPASKGKAKPPQQKKPKSKAGHKGCDEDEPAEGVDASSASDVYAGKAYVDVMALFLAENDNDRKKWISSDVRKRAIDAMSESERKRRKL